MQSGRYLQTEKADLTRQRPDRPAGAPAVGIKVSEDCFDRSACVWFGVLETIQVLHDAEQGAHEPGVLARIVGYMHLPEGDHGPRHGSDPALLFLHRHLMENEA